MAKPSNWPKGTETRKTTLSLPHQVLEAAKIRAVREERTLQELVAEALEDYLRKARKGGKS